MDFLNIPENFRRVGLRLMSEGVIKRKVKRGDPPLSGRWSAQMLCYTPLDRRKLVFPRLFALLRWLKYFILFALPAVIVCGAASLDALQ